MHVDVGKFVIGGPAEAVPPFHHIFSFPFSSLQGHPEAPCQWPCHIDHILQNYQFISTVHVPCIFHPTTINKENVLFLCQVDDFAIATNNEQLYTQICNSLDTNLLVVPMKCQGLLTHYYGLDIVQTCTFITIHCGSYIWKLFSNHGWDDMKLTYLPIPADIEYISTLDTATAPTNEAPFPVSWCYWGAYLGDDHQLLP
jgi:hypothetical protein